MEIEDRPLDQDRTIPRRELLDRLQANTCELCGSRHKVQVHHIRRLSDLKVKGQREKPTWLKVMSAMKRKTLIVCERCHVAIHAGRPTGHTRIRRNQSKDRATGEPDDAKVSSPVRRGADGKGRSRLPVTADAYGLTNPGIRRNLASRLPYEEELKLETFQMEPCG